MKKTIINSLVFVFVAISGINAQSLQEGINHLYADRYQSAVATFQKLLAANPNNIDATYWLGQTYLDMDDNDAARKLYDDALMASSNAPLMLVGKGHVQLLDNKLTDARQSFETAISMTRGKKGDDPVILNAVGRANVDAKKGDLIYAIEKLQAAVQRDSKNAEIYINLGNAIRKYKPGEAGNEAYENYKKAIEVNPNLSYAYVRLAKLFETQKNWDLVLANLNEAVARDPNFSLAYYELFYYYWFKEQDNAKAEEMLNKYIASRPNEDKTEHDYLQSQLCFSKKDYECAISKAENVARSMGAKIKPKVFRQLAYSYFGKKEYANAKKNIDEFFKRTKDEPFPPDYQLKADILSDMGADDKEVFKVFIEGASIDTVLQSKIDFLNKGADFFKAKGNKCFEAEMKLVVYNTKPNPNPGELFFIGLPLYQCGNLVKADSIFKIYEGYYPDSVYGHYWRGRVNYELDTTMLVEPFATNMIESYQKTLDAAWLDKERLKTFGTFSAQFLAGYFNNVRGSKDTALMYTYRGLEFDSTNSTLKYIKQVLEAAKNQAPKKNTGSSSKPTGKVNAAIKSAAIKS